MSKSDLQNQLTALFDHYETWAKVAEKTKLTTLTVRNIVEGISKAPRQESAAAITKAFEKISGAPKAEKTKSVKADAGGGEKATKMKKIKKTATATIIEEAVGPSRIGYVNFGLALSKVPESTQQNVCSLLEEAHKAGLTLRDLLQALKGHLEGRAAKSAPTPEAAPVTTNGAAASA